MQAAPQPQLSEFSVRSEHGRAVLLHCSGLRRPLHRDGAPLEALQDGWSVGSIYVGFAPIVLVFLSHRDGASTRWIIDASNMVHETPLSTSPEPVRLILCSCTRRLLQNVHRYGADALADWNRLPRITRLELLADTRRDPGPAADSLVEVIGSWGDDAGNMLDVCTDDDMLSVLLPNGTEIPILQDARPLRHSGFQPGWAATGLYRDFAPFFLLELRHVSGMRASWLLDGSLSLIGDIAGAKGAMLDELCARAMPVVDRYLDCVLALADPWSDPVVVRYLQLNLAVRNIIIGHCGSLVRPRLIPLGLQQMPAMLNASATAGRAGAVLLRRDAVERTVTTDLHRHSIDAILSGLLQWPSPVDGSSAPLRGVFIFDDYVFVYQFTDDSGLDFLVIASDRSCRVIGVVIPAINMMLFDDRDLSTWDHDNWLRGNRGADFWTLLIRHLNHYPHEMATRQRTAQAIPVNVLLADVHLCHHLWNDLTGIEALCEAVPATLLPTTMIIGAAEGQAELFGPVDQLFPALLGHVDRSLPNIDSFVRWAYGRNVWPTRITRKHVSAALRHRVVAQLARQEEAVAIRAGAVPPQPGGRDAPVIVFGLRVEDRTLVDLPAFCEAFVAFMVERYPGSVIIFDGHNSGPGRPPGSVIHGMAYALAREPPEQVEARLVALLSRRFAADPVTIVDNIGQSIAASLAWCEQADAAMALWGAGLTKLRWLANLPTFMLTTRSNITSRYDRQIYHDAAYMEAPTPAIYADPELITDMPRHVSLATGHIQSGRECFTADIDALLSQFDAFLTEVRRTSGRPPSGCYR